MKDYIKINRALDNQYLKAIEENITNLRKQGLYPEKFTYPITLQFELTGRCNLACKHCYNRSGDADRETLMTPDKWCSLAKEIVKDGGIFQCILSGGEPLLLGDRLFDIMDILHDDGTSFVVITNGYLLTKEKVKRFSKYRYYWFQVSIDGSTAEIHDEFRGVRGSFERAVNGALEISQAGIPLVIAHTVTPKNLGRVEDMVDLAYSMGASRIILGEVLPSGRAITNEDIILTKEQKNCLYEVISKLQNKYNEKIEIRRSADLGHQMKRYSLENNAGGIIRPNGEFRLDCMAPFIIGNVLNTSLKELWMKHGINAWKSERVQKFIASINEETQKGNIQNHVDKDILV